MQGFARRVVRDHTGRLAGRETARAYSGDGSPCSTRLPLGDQRVRSRSRALPRQVVQKNRGFRALSFIRTLTVLLICWALIAPFALLSASDVHAQGGGVTWPKPAPFFGPECEQNGGTYECRLGLLDQATTWQISSMSVTGTCPGSVPRSFEKAAECVKRYLEVDYGFNYCSMNFLQTVPTAPSDYRSNLGHYIEWQGYTRWISKRRMSEPPYCYQDTLPYTSLLSRWNRNAYCPAGWEAMSFSYCRKPPKDCCLRKGNPIDPGSGEKIQTEIDIPQTGATRLSLSRTYRSQGFIQPPGGDASTPIMGMYWRHSYQRELVYYSGSTPVAFIVDATGERVTFRKVNGSWRARPFSNERLEDILDVSNAVIGWRYTTASDAIEEYDINGRIARITDRVGTQLLFAYTDGTTTPPNGVVATDHPSGVKAGLLRRVTDSFGRTLSFDYRLDGTLVRVTDPAGSHYNYTYDDQSRLKTAGRPDGTSRTYMYYVEDGKPVLSNSSGLLTGIINESNTRYANFGYDSQRRAISTEHAGGTNRFTVSYSWSGTVPATNGSVLSGFVTDPLNTAKTTRLVLVGGVYRDGGEAQPCSTPSCTGTDSTTIGYDANGNVAFRVDFKGNRTNYAYDTARALETSRTEGLTSSGGTTTATRTTTTTWHPTFRLPATVTEQLGVGGAGGVKVTNNTYDTNGNLLQRLVSAPAGTRTWSWTYDSFGRVLTATDPLGRVSVNTYYPNVASQNDLIPNSRGMLATTTNAAGHTTSITAYNAHGQPLAMTDANGLVTTMTYDARQRLTSRTVGTETTIYEYAPTGLLTKVTLPDGSWLAYAYDAAQRLVQIQDGLGNKMVYTLDAMGNRIKEDALDPAGALARTRSRIFDALNRLQKDIGGLGATQTTTYSYDANDNQTGVTDPLNRVTTNQYDALNRLIQVNDPLNGSAAPTRYEYDAQDNLTKVTDPKNLATTYTYNGFNELVSQTSPDTGTTSFTYDAAGNMLTKTDARGVVATYSYDVLNRVTSISYPATTSITGNGPAQTITYQYDSCPNGKGRLCSFTDRTGTTSYSYDVQGRVLSKTQTVGGLTQTVAYRYNAAGQMDEMTLPSGKKVALNYTNNRVTGLTVDGQAVVKLAEYEPFGPIGEWTWGNDTPANPNKHTRFFDLDGRNTKIESGVANGAIEPSVIVYDAASRITALQHLTNPTSNTVDPTRSASYGYDNLDRLTSVTPGGGNLATPQSYTYDAIGNRLSNNVNGAITSYSYGAGSHRLIGLTGATNKSFGFDAAGNRLTDGIQSWIYGGDGRPAAISITQTSPVSIQAGINALGQRVLKVVNSGASTSTTSSTTRFVYDEAGRLIGEYDLAGRPIQETIWLNDLPVAVLK
jgi:YD repeat-containing protein